MQPTTKQSIFWTIRAIGVLLFSLATLVSFYEWWNVRINKDLDSYPWGPINNNPWYYANDTVYANYMLVTGLIMLLLLVLLFTFLAKRQKEKALYSMLGCTGLFLLMIVSSQIL